ncbi:C-C chemokine receptor-like 2 [Orycteropus afer afer]|uniref:C-C chemokine receptor-like 2 n=1 Tax=Orycteropus afer afer TaxID=1230840 RepID=A0A8B7AQJ0_ORYAF|nr:C-C chemokine receptor-like 2 [Orycteropus afer afer]
MDNYTLAPDNEYDVLIEGDLTINDIEQCDKYDANVLPAQLVPKLYSPVFVICLLYNLLVMLILIKYKGLRHMENIYFLNLAVSNLLFSLTLPFWAYTASHGGILGDPICKILIGIYFIGLYSEACFNMLLTVHRYLVFFHVQSISLAAKTVPCGIFTSAFVWMVAVLVTLPECIVYRPQLGRQEDKCSPSKSRFLPADETSWKHFLTLKMNILGLLLPLFVFIFCYVRMRRTLRLKEIRYDLFKLVFAVMVAFLLMWAPYNIALFLSTFKEYFSLNDCKSNYGLDRGVQITEIIATTHCCVNPLLHMFVDQAFRRHLCHLLPLKNNTPLQPREESGQDALWEQHRHSTRV